MRWRIAVFPILMIMALGAAWAVWSCLDDDVTTVSVESGAGIVLDIDVNADGTVLATVGTDKGITLWRLPQGSSYLSLKGNLGVETCVAFSPSSTLLASGSEDGYVAIWDYATESRVATYSHSASVTDIAFSSDGRLLASCGDRTVKIWDSESRVERGQLQGHRGIVGIWEAHSDTVLSVAFSSDGSAVATVGADGILRTWSTSTFEVESTLEVRMYGPVSAVFGPANSVLVSCGDGSILVVKAEKLHRVLRGHTDVVWQCSYSLARDKFASISRDGSVKLWDASTWTVGRTFSSSRVTDRPPIVFSPNGKFLAWADFARFSVYEVGS